MHSDPRHPSVLVVDDDLDTRELYKIMLESVGYRVEAAGSVRSAIENAMAAAPHVVLTDWRLPDGTGFDVSDGLRQRAALRHVPIVAVSGLSMSRAMTAEAQEHGFTALLVKPASPDEILRSIRLALESGTAQRLRAAALRLRRYAAASARLMERRRAQNTAAIDAGVLLQRVADRSGDDITLMLADDSAHYVAAGGSARELTGYEPRELVSLSVWDLTPAPDATSSRGLWNSFIASGTQEGRYILRRRDGVPVEAQYCAIANVIPGLHVSAIAEASQLPSSL